MFNVYKNQVGKQEVGIWWVQKRFPRYGVPIWSLWPNIRFLPSIVAEKNARQTDRGKTVYPPPPSGSGGIIYRKCMYIVFILQCQKDQNNCQIVWKEQKLRVVLIIFHGVVYHIITQKLVTSRFSVDRFSCILII